MIISYCNSVHWRAGENSEVPITENGRKSGEQIVRTGQVEFSLIAPFTVLVSVPFRGETGGEEIRPKETSEIGRVPEADS